MSILNVRNIISLAAGLGASAVAVRNALGKEIDKRADKAVQAAVEEAREEIRLQAHTLMSRGFRRFLITTLAKTGVVLFIAALFFFGLISSALAAIGLGISFVAFAGYDVFRSIPTLKFLAGERKKYGWRPRLILSETVSAQVFEQVLERATDAPVDRTESVLMLLSGKKRDDVVERVARAVAEIAATTSWEDIRPIIIRFALRFITLFALYSALVWGVVWLIRHAAR